jgi:hypothetical protein
MKFSQRLVKMEEKKKRVITLAGVVFTIGCQSTINKHQTPNEKNILKK